MHTYISKILFAGILIIPSGLFVLLPYLGSGVPLEGNVVRSDAFLNGSQNEIEVAFFGYAGCSFICPRSLFTLGEVIDSLKVEYPDKRFGGTFVDINAETQVGRANQYSEAFSPYISGKNVGHEELEELKEEFGLSILDDTEQSGEIFHTDHFFVLQKRGEDWEIIRVLANSTTKLTIYNVLEGLLKRSS